MMDQAGCMLLAGQTGTGPRLDRARCSALVLLLAIALGACASSQGPYSFVDRAGRVVRGGLRFASPYSEGMAAARVSGRWGYLDASGHWAIKPRFRDAASFSEGMAWVRREDGAAGYVDHDGNWVLGPTGGTIVSPGRRSDAGTSSERRARRVPAEHLRYPMGEFHEGLAPVRIEGVSQLVLPDRRRLSLSPHSYGFVDGMGQVAIAPAFDEVSHFEQGLAEVWLGSPLSQAVIDTTGAYVVPPIMQQFALRSGITCMRKGHSRVLTDSGMDVIRDISEYGLLQTGLGRKQIVLGEPIPPFSKQDAVCIFHEGLMPVHKDGKYGFLNRRGELAIPLAFDEVRHFADGLAAARAGGRWGAINKRGRWVIPARFAEPFRFSEGLAGATKARDGLIGFIDKRGVFVIPPRYTYADEFSHGRALVSTAPRSSPPSLVATF
ncbi:MAG: WG repeat-containing protein [Proteobacteria bacterium]|nr:WG repeat-containing protein [Pseudomonadota bacterium]